jgi:hypothetical protein
MSAPNRVRPGRRRRPPRPTWPRYLPEPPPRVRRWPVAVLTGLVVTVLSGMSGFVVGATTENRSVATQRRTAYRAFCAAYRADPAAQPSDPDGVLRYERQQITVAERQLTLARETGDVVLVEWVRQMLAQTQDRYIEDTAKDTAAERDGAEFSNVIASDGGDSSTVLASICRVDGPPRHSSP